MIVYIAFFLLVTFLSLLSIAIKNNSIKYASFIFIGMLVALFAALRFEVGPDWFSYSDTLDQSILMLNSVVEDKLIITFTEPLFLVLMLPFKLLGIEYYYFSFCITTISVYLGLRLIWKFGHGAFLGVIIYLTYGYLANWSIMRQALATVLCYYYIFYYARFSVSKKVVYFLLIPFIHYSSFVFLFSFLLSKRINPSPKWMFIILISAFILGYSNFVFLFFSGLQFADFTLFVKVLEYYQNPDYSVSISTISAISEWGLIIFLLTKFRPIHGDDNYSELLKICFLGLAIYCLLGNISIIGARLAYYYKFSFIFLIPSLLKGFVVNKRILIAALFMVLSFVHFYSHFNNERDIDGTNPYIPYKI